MIEQARIFAIAAHKACGQKRKYTGECYTVHLEDVAGLVEHYGGSKAMIAAAWLHDVVEDTDISGKVVREFFGNEIADLVAWVTDVSTPRDGNRKARKNLDMLHLSKAPPEAQTIKLCDIVSNAYTIVTYDPKFAEVYLQEKQDLLEVMIEGNADAYSHALKCVTR